MKVMHSPGSLFPQAKSDLDEANARFWNELCGTTLAQHLGITDRSLESLQAFDRAYFDIYPYLLTHVPVSTMRGQAVLEIGLGYGTLGQAIARAGADYTGMDIAQGPVDMMNHRLALQRLPGEALVGNMLECPFPNESFDCVVSIGCFHHTGSIQRCLDHAWRVLRPGGRAFVMVYNRFSLRQWTRWPRETWAAAMRERYETSDPTVREDQRRAYDANSSGGAAPETEFVSERQLRQTMRRFSHVKVFKENCDSLAVLGIPIVPRKLLLPLLGPILGLDLYVHASK